MELLRARNSGSSRKVQPCVAGVAPDVPNCRLHVIQHKGPNLTEEICIPKLHRFIQSGKHLLDFQVLVKAGSVCLVR